MQRWLTFWVSLSLGTLGCKAEPTQLLVVIRSDLPPADIRVVRVTVTDMEDARVMSQRDFDVGPDVTLPFSFGVAPPNDKVRRRVEIVAEALPDVSAAPVVVRRARVGFIRHETLLLTLFLGQDCRNVLCSPDETCDRGRCIDARVDESSLEAVRPGEELGTDAAGIDASRDAGASPDGGSDAGFDAGSPPSTPPTLRSPWNGQATGSRRLPVHLSPTVRWEPVPTATHYEVVASTNCVREDFRTCDLTTAPRNQAPASSGTILEATIPQLEGGFTVWTVRACNDDGCGPYAEPRYLLVGVDRTDVTGDGYGDVVAGAPDAKRRDGAVALFAGPPDLAPAELSVLGSGTESGGALAYVGDVDGDAIVDLAVVGREVAGRYELFAGAATPSRIYQIRLPSSHGRRPAVAGCDLDGDGYSDVALGFSGTVTGEVQIFPGAASPARTPLPALTPPTTDVGGAFGAALACVGDVDGDGLADLLVGAPDLSLGRAHLIHGDASRTFDRVLTIEPPTEPPLIDFGRSVTGLGDIDGDGLSDFAIAARGSTANEVLVYAGSDPTAEPIARLVAPSRSLDYGNAISGAGDVNGDGAPDLLVGAPSAGGGAAFIHLGPTFEARIQVNIPVLTSGGQLFGAAVALGGDVDADGFADFAVGCSNCEEDGRVVYYGGAATVSALKNPNQNLDGTLGMLGAFGTSIATAGP